MSIELDGIALIRHVRDPDTGATTLVHSVHNINVSEKRSIVEHRIPGLQGGVLKDLGRDSIKISFEGLIFGGDALDFLERIRSKYKAGAPVPFSSDISGVAEVTQVLIEEFQVEEVGGVINTYNYWMVLREHTPPPEEEETPPSQDEEAEEEVKQVADDTLDEDFVEGYIQDEEGRPLRGVTVIVSSTEGEWKEESLTNEDGHYQTKTKFKPEKYTIAFEIEGYDTTEEEVNIESSKRG